MKIYETENYEEMSRKAANILSAQVILKPDCVLGLATKSSSWTGNRFYTNRNV